MQNFKKKQLSKLETAKISGGKREVKWIDWDGDGTLDKVVEISRNGELVRRNVKYK